MPRAQKPKFRRNSAGIKLFLMTDPGVRTLMSQAGDAVAGNVASSGVTDSAGKSLPAKSEVGISTWPGKRDRVAAMVTITHPAAVPIEAKHGVLSKATTSAGLEWGRKSSKR